MHKLDAVVPLALVAALAGAAPTAGGADLARVVLALAAILAAAKLAGDLAERIGQPAVLGELVVGVLLGNLDLVGVPWFRALTGDPSLNVLAQLGVLILLFDVGLESTVREMLKVGASATLVAVLGVATPFALGWGVGAVVLPQHSPYAHAFLGATLTATSVGITARVLKDLGKANLLEARIILGAAVIDDVLGLVILAVVAGVISAAAHGATLSYGATGLVVLKAAAFLVVALGLGVALTPRLFRQAARLRGRGVLLATALVLCFVLAYLASAIGLAPIVGAYAAGLILEDLHWREFERHGEQRLQTLVAPIASFLVPVFFVMMGMRVELATLGQPGVLLLAALLTAAAILGKQACALGARGPGVDRLSVGLGMIPRGEVGLIFASIGLGLVLHGERIVDGAVYSAVVIMVIVTTLVTPPALKWSLGRGARARISDGGG
ncbi:MAG TPA: cation:proton antiporter [Gemmatimonadales bacterium]|nr:cation:proton antiporter [Gemmatimonadales bacterium]